MKKKRYLMIGVMACLVLLSQTMAFGSAKTLFILGTGIKSLGSDVTANQSMMQISNKLYVPGTATEITDFQITSGVVDTKGNPGGRNVQVDTSVGATLTARVWRVKVGLDGYYGDTSLGMSQANFDDSALTWNWTGLAVDFKAAPPYAPTISQFVESTTRTTLTSGGSPSTSSTLNVTSGGGATGSDGKREVNTSGCQWLMWEDGKTPSVTPLAGKTGQTLSLAASDVTAGQTYVFKVGYTNVWGGPTWSTEYKYTVAAGGALGSGGSVTYALKKGINGVGLPVGGTINVAVNSGTPTAADTLQKMVTAISGVTAISVWDATGQKLGGATFDASGNVTFQTPGFDLNSAPVAGSALYITVGADESVTISK